VAAAIGPVRAKFRGRLLLEDVEAPLRYTLRFEGDGGAAGHARGTARVTLDEDAGATVLRYTVDSRVGGRIAQIGNRLIDSAALKLADDFFAAFEQRVGAGSAAAAAPAPAEPAARRHPLWWIALAAVLVALIVLALR
jgi:uncharacterized protein